MATKPLKRHAHHTYLKQAAKRPDTMSSSQNDAGLMSSAGLVRYFDSDSPNGITIDPKTVSFIAVAFGITVLFLNIFI